MLQTHGRTVDNAQVEQAEARRARQVIALVLLLATPAWWLALSLPVHAGRSLPWWGLTAAMLVARRLKVPQRIGVQRVYVSLCGAVAVVGLVLATPATVLLSTVLAWLLHWLIDQLLGRWRQDAVKTAFNLAHQLLWLGVAVAVWALLHPAGPALAPAAVPTALLVAGVASVVDVASFLPSFGFVTGMPARDVLAQMWRAIILQPALMSTGLLGAFLVAQGLAGALLAVAPLTAVVWTFLFGERVARQAQDLALLQRLLEELAAGDTEAAMGTAATAVGVERVEWVPPGTEVPPLPDTRSGLRRLPAWAQADVATPTVRYGVLVFGPVPANDPGLDARATRLAQTVADQVGQAAERRGMAADRAEAARRDSLTGLLLLAAFTEAIGTLAADRPVTVLTVNVGRLREVNEVFGREGGDAALAVLGARLREALPAGTACARLGGHLLAAVLPGVDEVRATWMGQLVAAAMARPVPVGEAFAELTATVGTAMGSDAALLLHRADLAVHKAGERGVTMAAYEPGLERDTARRLRLVGDLRSAIEGGRLTVVFQPQADVLSGVTVGVEALARWHHPELGPIGPDEFVPLAESSGLIQSLTGFVLYEALAQCRRWLDAGLEVPVSVNLSARNLGDAGLAEQVSAAASRHSVAPRLVTLEVTETAVMIEPARAIAALARLRELGFRVSIDDFGTGHSSLAYLHELPADEVKLDRAFTAGLVDGRGTALVRAAIDLAHALDLSLVAEGVEDAETLARLGELGADVAQGYHLCRPRPAAELSGWLRKHAGRREPTLAAAHAGPR